jgi:hypothetical protein
MSFFTHTYMTVFTNQRLHSKVFQGPMLWSQFSAISPNFQRNKWRFLKNQCYDHFFRKITFCLGQKRRFFRQIFLRKFLKNHDIGPRFVTILLCRYNSCISNRTLALLLFPPKKSNFFHILNTYVILSWFIFKF